MNPINVNKKSARRVLSEEERVRQFAFEQSRLVTLAAAVHRLHSIYRAIDDSAVVQTFALAAIKSAGSRTPGVDRVTGEKAKKKFVVFIESIFACVTTAAFMPLAVREIAKPDGGVRKLNCPILAERAIGMAVSWVLSLLFDASFMRSVVGCRPGRGPHHALDLAVEYMPNAAWVAKIDFKSFFDGVLHKPLLASLEQRIDDKKFITLIQGLIQRPAVGSPSPRLRGIAQGCPASPVLANIFARPFDQWLDDAGVPFVRYVDDVAIFWPGDRAGLERLLASASDFLKTLGIELAANKTVIAPVTVGVPLVGHLVQQHNGVGEVHPHPDRVARFQARMYERADALFTAINQEETNTITNQIFNHLRGFGAFYRPTVEALQIGAQAYDEAMRKYPRLGPITPSGFPMGEGGGNA